MRDSDLDMYQRNAGSIIFGIREWRRMDGQTAHEALHGVWVEKGMIYHLAGRYGVDLLSLNFFFGNSVCALLSDLITSKHMRILEAWVAQRQKVIQLPKEPKARNNNFSLITLQQSNSLHNVLFDSASFCNAKLHYCTSFSRPEPQLPANLICVICS